MMSMFYIVAVPFLIMSVYMLFYLRGLRRHDQVLFRFCNLRREVMQLLRDEEQHLSREDYFAARNALEVLNQTIHNYKDHCNTFFNLKKLGIVVRVYRASSDEMKTVSPTSNPRIEEINKKLGAAIVLGFLTYTPFLHYTLVFRMVLAIMHILAGVGARKVRRFARTSVDTLTMARRQMDQYDVHRLASA